MGGGGIGTCDVVARCPGRKVSLGRRAFEAVIKWKAVDGVVEMERPWNRESGSEGGRKLDVIVDLGAGMLSFLLQISLVDAYT